MSRNSLVLEGIRYDALTEKPEDNADRPMGNTEFDDDASWSWEARQQLDRGSPANETTPFIVDDRQSGAASPVTEPDTSHSGSRMLRRQPFAKASVRESRARRSTWTVIHCDGTRSILHSDKRGIIQKFKLGIPIRDMRLLDPNLLTSETGKILVRDNAIVISIEHVRLIVTADLVIVPREGFDHNPLHIRFNHILFEAIADFARETVARQQALAKLDEARQLEGYESDGTSDEHEVAPLPYELVVLELAMKDVCQLCNQLTKDLEALVYPALDTLTKSVTTANLEKMRKQKTRHQRLFNRVQTVREELQRFLEDDDDMTKMCLTRKKELEGPSSGVKAQLQMEPSYSNRRQSLSIPINTPKNTAKNASPFFQPAHPHGSPSWQPFERSESGVLQQQIMAQEAESESQEAVENLLESYFMQIDSTYDKLQAVGEYIEDTEEYINIDLDSSRNRLLRLEIILTAGTFAIAIFSVIAGILGENLIIPPGITKTVTGFAAVNLITLLCCLLVFAGIVAYVRFKRLI